MREVFPALNEISKELRAKPGFLDEYVSKDPNTELYRKNIDELKLYALIIETLVVAWTFLSIKTYIDHLLKRSKEALETKSSFLVPMSHEIRTPLNEILDFSRIVSGKIELE